MKKKYDQIKIKLSDAYLDKTAEIMLELQVKVININLSANHPILQKCRNVKRQGLWWILFKSMDLR